MLADLGLARHFAVVVGGDSVGVLKPDPLPLRHCMGRMGVASAWFVGDSEIDAATAVAAGVPFALFTRGYRHRPAAEIAATHRFDDWAALPGWCSRRG